MRSDQACLALITGLLVGSPALADETPVDIQTDLEGDYFIVEQSGTANRPILVAKRAAPGYDHFIKREFDCDARRVRYLAEGDSLQSMTEAEPEPEMEPISAGSISDQLSKYVCPEAKPESQPAAE
ncbi:hypothetical protein G3480_01205 [Thiorhodococcus mannitoliphagus]|uniref:Uncharacterized protein n=1 Tax=Thiorhodococcus mannitoliphagus TaxID=329406 RepID=A0A6P1DTA5_9GAMM|nr:hypothetical protein [Thiorhodococcus mannitoliphagus]NEX18945.1 hypothetical protein [Thiorhodococcus mannitoliphagus]